MPFKFQFDLYLVTSPTIFGVGTGSDNITSIKVPVLTKHAVGIKKSCVVGTNILVLVNVVDLAKFYALVSKNYLQKPGMDTAFYSFAADEFIFGEASKALRVAL